jgi:hypothetical protein
MYYNHLFLIIIFYATINLEITLELNNNSNKALSCRLQEKKNVINHIKSFLNFLTY